MSDYTTAHPVREDGSRRAGRLDVETAPHLNAQTFFRRREKEDAEK